MNSSIVMFSTNNSLTSQTVVAEQKDLSQYDNQTLPNASFTETPTSLVLLRLLVNAGWITTGTENQITISDIGVGGNQFTLTART
jgi:hypothetical protein